MRSYVEFPVQEECSCTSKVGHKDAKDPMRTIRKLRNSPYFGDLLGMGRHNDKGVGRSRRYHLFFFVNAKLGVYGMYHPLTFGRTQYDTNANNDTLYTASRPFWIPSAVLVDAGHFVE